MEFKYLFSPLCSQTFKRWRPLHWENSRWIIGREGRVRVCGTVSQERLIQFFPSLVWMLCSSDLVPRDNCAFSISLVEDAGAVQAGSVSTTLIQVALLFPPFLILSLLPSFPHAYCFCGVTCSAEQQHRTNRTRYGFPFGWCWETHFSLTAVLSRQLFKQILVTKLLYKTFFPCFCHP